MWLAGPAHRVVPIITPALTITVIASLIHLQSELTVINDIIGNPLGSALQCHIALHTKFETHMY